MLICLFNGFVAGLPLYFLIHLIPAWLRTEGVDLKTIGLFALIGIPYNWKFLWAPLLDRYSLPFLGLRRGWMLVAQIALLIGMAMVGQLDPKESIWPVAYLATAIAFFSASQDIVLDAYRRELLTERELGLGNALYVNGYRAAVFVPGGLGVLLGDYLPWSVVFPIIGLFMLIGIVKTAMISELPTPIARPKRLIDAIVIPFKEFFTRDGVWQGLLVLAFLFSYKLGDNLATALSTPFFLDLGFSKTTIGSMVKLVSVSSLLVGSLVGGIIIYRIGINRGLWLFGIAQLVTIIGFAILSEAGNDEVLLGVVIGAEYLGVGLGAAALTAFMARATNINFTATQFALLSSLIALPRTFANATAGFLIEGVSPTDGLYYQLLGAFSGMGYTNFFIFCASLSLPGMFLLLWVAPWDAGERGGLISR